jgi:hypothetical protein
MLSAVDLRHRYFTDRRNLYRLVGWLIRSRGAGLAALEDCRTLDIVLVSSNDLDARSLRPVA